MGTVTQWKQLLLSALESNSHLKHSPYFQFATIGCNGRPSNRSVVFRGFEENSDRIQINTDCRTRKIEELKHCPFAEQREKSWFASSLKSRLQYLGPNPGLPCLSEQSLNEFFLDPSSGPVATFCLLVLDPDQVDYLNLKSNQRTVSTLSRCANGEMCWNSEMINP
ncbi:pyridoxine/pyridoxamine 5'-phosphate oxidase 2 isoform X2 [Populus trichocarpa]|uniref:pyridoxine/pyridoxamine 5'-phosphate oxidase 2 isoform X2 n=1 Tax=Populus trichocarpa TaxID=3694 RepID=UPI000D188925|nr:pyridoxine/pyridoxamine 5'-phosphate oxidase 2 isoform X2 [Populus trichocarpa]|eukprot:XP_024441113.1 pyridoxine/pyridoxamine 5'-phosphate oxidase 2 isoform X2 [Populus trichocarpa]